MCSYEWPLPAGTDSGFSSHGDRPILKMCLTGMEHGASLDKKQPHGGRRSYAHRKNNLNENGYGREETEAKTMRGRQGGEGRKTNQ